MTYIRVLDTRDDLHRILWQCVTRQRAAGRYNNAAMLYATRKAGKLPRLLYRARPDTIPNAPKDARQIALYASEPEPIALNNAYPIR